MTLQETPPDTCLWQQSCPSTTDSGGVVHTRHTASLRLHNNDVSNGIDSSALSEESFAVSVSRYKQECLTFATVTLESHRQRSASTRLLEDFHVSYYVPAEGLGIVANLNARLERTQT
jgi:hypothetical protein